MLHKTHHHTIFYTLHKPINLLLLHSISIDDTMQMDPHSSLNPLHASFPLLKPMDSYEYSEDLTASAALHSDLCSSDLSFICNPMVSSNSHSNLTANTIFPFVSAVSIEDLEFIESPLDYGVDENVASNVGSMQNQNVGFYGFLEFDPTPQDQIQKTHLKKQSKMRAKIPKTGGFDEGLDIATVSVDLIQNRRPYKCLQVGCEKTFKNQQTLKIHHKTHYARGNFAPEQCGDAYAVPPQASKAGHNKKSPCRCPLCGRAFVGLYELRRHFGRKHSEGEKMHHCKKCGKKFYVEVDLRDHEKLCGEPLGCKCGLKFAFKCNLMAHKRAHPECIKGSMNNVSSRGVINGSDLNAVKHYRHLDRWE